MGLSKRLMDSAKANLNALLDKAAGDTVVDELTDEALEAELARRRERRKREEEERRGADAAAEAALKRAKERAAAEGRPAPERRPRAPQAGRTPPRSGHAPSLPEKKLRELYEQLETPYGAGFDEVKKSFRRLMRKYHPDLHAGNPTKHKAATQLTMSLTQAYNELEAHLTGGRRG